MSEWEGERVKRSKEEYVILMRGKRSRGGCYVFFGYLLYIVVNLIMAGLRERGRKEEEK